jgi:hypothetical protein
MGFKKDLLEEEGKKNLGEEVFARDSRHPKTKYRAGTDDGRRKLHPARWNRQPLINPEKYYHKIPKKREAVIRNFPTEHLGITGQVSQIRIYNPTLLNVSNITFLIVSTVST